MFLIYDTETTGLPRNFEAPVTDLENWPRVVQLAWQLHDITGKLVESGDYLIKPDNFTIPYNASKVHGISTELALEQGENLRQIQVNLGHKSPVVTAIYTHLTSLCQTQHQKRLHEFMGNL